MKRLLQKLWYLVWEDNTPLGWILNLAFAFLIIKFLLFPTLGFVFGTDLPVVAVVSGSMEHKFVAQCTAYTSEGQCLKHTEGLFTMCGNFDNQPSTPVFADWWRFCGEWYEQYNITHDAFVTFDFFDGFNTGDVIVIFHEQFSDISVGDIVIFMSEDGIPIIHRVVTIDETTQTFTTKGDHNSDSISTPTRSEINVPYEKYKGTASFRIPFVGYVKIWFVQIISMIQ